MTRSDTRDREREAQRDMHGVSVGAETNFPSGETLEGTKQRVVSSPP